MTTRQSPFPQDEDPRQKFRRLISSSEDNDDGLEEKIHSGNQISSDIGRMNPSFSISDTQPRKVTLASPDQKRFESVEGMSDTKNQNQLESSRKIRNQSIPSPTLEKGTKPHKTSKRPINFGCLVKSLMISSFIIAVSGVCLISMLFYEYYRIASTLPEVNDLRGRASKFETTRILDRNGNVLYEILDPNAGRRTYVPIEKISPYLIAATIATEDKDFYSHPGVDFSAILRAFWQNYSGSGTVSGASTITQQLARGLLFSPEERVEISYNRKIREAILATEITRRYSKDEILELYLNENYYGNFAYGIEAASETYFGTTADRLTLSQSAFLAGLPQAPSIYDVYTEPELTFQRQEDVLILMYQTSQEQNCIFVSNSPQKICLDPISITQASEEIRNYHFQSPDIKIKYPHWVTYVRSELESLYDPQTIYRSGFNVYTTIDPVIQDQAEKAVEEQVSRLRGQNVTNGAVIVLHPATREILGMVGSADFNNKEISGQVNMAISPRQPGSAMKPLTYLAAFEKGWTPSTLIWDVPSEFPPSGQLDDPSPPYIPVNYTGKFYGPVTVRTALSNSLNIPAVKALEFVGIYDNPETVQEDGLISIAKRAGITTLTRPDYGLSLTLGGGEVTLLSLTNFYATLADEGRYLEPASIQKITDRNGLVVYEKPSQLAKEIFRPEHTYLISSILSDNESRGLVFGTNTILNLPFPVAVKTGTTDSFRDNWTLGYTPDIAIGVWVGNADYTPMQNTTGLTGAAPIWAELTKASIDYLKNSQPTPFSRQSSIVDRTICEISGTFPSEWCSKLTSEIFVNDQPPLPKEEDLVQKVSLDTWTEYLSSPECGNFMIEKTVLNVDDPWARKWLRKDPQGQQLTDKLNLKKPIIFKPSRSCQGNDPRPSLQFESLSAGQTINESLLTIYATADATQWFDQVRLEIGEGLDPQNWQLVEVRNQPLKNNDHFNEWDLTGMATGAYVLRMYMVSTEGTYAEVKLPIFIQIPTPTPTPTPEPTQTPTPTVTFTPTFTPTYTLIPTITQTPVPSATYTLQPTPTEFKFPKPSETVMPTSTNSP